MNVDIRPARPGDGDGIARATVDLVDEYLALDPERFRHADGDVVAWLEADLARPVPQDSVWLVADVDGVAVGTAEATLHEPMEDAEMQPIRDVGMRRAYLTYLAVQTAFRSRGIGSLLMAEVESWARARGAGLLLTDTNVRGRAMAFYERHGFTPQSVILRKPLD